jgi:hypothetical protein
MSALGHKRTFRNVWPMSALPPKADMGQSLSESSKARGALTDGCFLVLARRVPEGCALIGISIKPPVGDVLGFVDPTIA